MKSNKNKTPGGFPAAGVMVPVILIAAWLRLHNLATVPAGMWYDEAYNALESLGVLETGQFQIFFIGNNGREPLLFYLLGPAIKIFGTNLYSVRFVLAMAGVIATPLLFRLTVCLFSKNPHRLWLGVVAAAGLATSYWHVSLSRVGLRAVLLVPFLIVCVYLFYRGLQTRRYRYFVGAGVALGLSQYTYLSARLLPLIFILFGLGRSLILYRRSNDAGLKFLWAGLGATGVCAGLVFLPLGLFFFFNPQAFVNRIEDVTPAFQPDSPALPAFVNHILASFRLFVDAGGILPRYTLAGRPLFDGFSLVGFWLGLLVLARRLSHPASLLIFCGLLVAWLPGPLSQDPVQELRQLGVLPFYYPVMAFGFIVIVHRLVRKRRPPPVELTPFWGVLITLCVLSVSGGLTTYDYFYRWAPSLEAYRLNRGEIFDTVQQAAALSETAVVALPFETYAYPSARYLLSQDFEEEILSPTEIVQVLKEKQRAFILGPTDAWPPQSGLAWLTRRESGAGVVYISNLLPQLPLEPNMEADNTAQPILNAQGAAIGYRRALDSDALASMLTNVAEARPVDFQFGELLQLTGYHLIPPLVVPGQASVLDLYWRGLSTQELGGDLFVHLTAADGTPATQFHEAPFSSESSRWHWNALIPGRHLIWTGADMAGGPYIIQLGLFEAGKQQRFAVTTQTGRRPLAGDQAALGLLYVADQGGDPRLPEVPLVAEMGAGIALIGYSIDYSAVEPDETASIAFQLHWRADEPVSEDYAVSIRLRDEQDRVVAQRLNVPPLAGLYPTSYWRPGEVIVDRLILPLESQSPPPGEYSLEIRLAHPVNKSSPALTNSSDEAAPANEFIRLDITLP